jgi:uncharacterized protein (DUF58 family)
LGIAAAAALLGAAWDAAALLVWAAAVAVLAGGLRWWVGSLRTGVSVEVAFEPARVFLGETAQVRVRLENRRRLPVPIVRVSLPLPEGLLAETAPAPTAFRGHRLRLSLDGRGEATFALPVFPRERGEFWLDTVTVDFSDPFDLAPVRREIQVPTPLLAMPRARGEAAAAVARALPFGRPRAGARLFEDREHFAGVRDYEPGDPMRHVHWRASAHAGTLQTKRFEPTRSAEVLLAIDLSMGEPFWRAVDGDAAEVAIAWTASLALRAIEAGWRTGLVANTHLRRGRGPLRVRPSTAIGHEAALFAALARMPSQPTTDLAPVLRELGRGMTRRSSVVLVSWAPGSALRHEMEGLRRRGIDVTHIDPRPRDEGLAS